MQLEQSQRNDKVTRRVENQRTSKDHLDNSIIRTCCHSNSSDKPSANADAENTQKSKIIITITDNTIDDRMTTTRKQKWGKNNCMAALND